MKPNPDYRNAPFECSGWIGGFMFYAGASPPLPEYRGECFWIKLPERQPMYFNFKAGKWVPWLNPPAGWESFVPEPKAFNLDDLRWRFPDC